MKNLRQKIKISEGEYLELFTKSLMAYNKRNIRLNKLKEIKDDNKES